jgi:methionine synthase II (cobalamin-independent)
LDLLQSAGKPWKLILPGPFTFSKMCENLSYKLWDELILDFADILADEIKSLSNFEPSYIQLSEPALVNYPLEKDEFSAVRNAVEIIKKSSSAVTSLHTYFGDISTICPDILEFDVDCIGIDFFQTPIDILDNYSFPGQLACGCIDSRNSLVQEPQDIISFSDEIFKRIEQDLVTLCPNCDLEFLPRIVAEKKVGVLGDVMKSIREGGG